MPNPQFYRRHCAGVPALARQLSAMCGLYVLERSRVDGEFNEDVSKDISVRGDVHRGFDRMAGGTRILGYPHGYGFGKPSFDPALVVVARV